jgi:putative oxidoreductase
MIAVSRTTAAVARSVLGLVFSVYGLNGFLHFLPRAAMSGPPADFFGALMATGYMLPLIMGTELVTGLMLLSGRYVPLALTVLAPIIVHIWAFHLFLAKGGFGIPAVLLVSELYLAWAYRSSFAGVLHGDAFPGADPKGQAEAV